jgi:hypothetical protein
LGIHAIILSSFGLDNGQHSTGPGLPSTGMVSANIR